MWSFLFSFTGRISRLKWWIGNISVIVIGIVVAFLVGGVLTGLGVEAQFNTESGTNLAGAVFMIPLLTIHAYIISVLAIKRFNDRERPHWLLAVYWSPMAIAWIDDLIGSPVSALGPAGVVVMNALLFAVVVWMVVELGILRGVPGSNRHGPDPLGQRRPATA